MFDLTQVTLAELSEGAILHNLRMRYITNDIYVRVLLVCVSNICC
jgi:myosin heavy subunit